MGLTVEERSKLIGTIFKLAMLMSNKNNVSTWSLLPKKILVASFEPKDNVQYKIKVISKNGNILDEKVLDLSSSRKTQNIYRHFTIRTRSICDDK